MQEAERQADKISFVAPASLRAELERRASESERSLSGEIRAALKEHLERSVAR